MTTPFVRYGSLMVPPAPFDSLGASVTGFIARADGAKLDALCRRVFTGPSGGAVDIRAIGDRVMLTWGAIDRVCSMTPPYDGVGAVAEPQVCVWVPVAYARTGDDGRPVAERFAVFVPYIWVDNAMSLATGRELFGYPKAWGWIGAPDPQATTRAWSLDAFGLDFGRGETASRRPLLRVSEGPSRDGDGERYDGILGLAEDVVRRIFHRSDDELSMSFALAKELWRDLRRHAFPHVFLKQVHAMEDGDAAALQQITEAMYTVRDAHARVLLRDFALDVEPLDSHPVIEELGLRSQTMDLAYELRMDFTVGGGRVVHDCLTQAPVLPVA